MTEKLQIDSTDIAIIGAGPSGAVAASYLVRRGYAVHVIERSHFPRFSIGESLLPQCMTHLEEAGLLDVVQRAGYQYKNGARFQRGDEIVDIDFRDKLTPGWGTTFQVERADFDQRLIEAAATFGATVRFGEQVVAFAADARAPSLDIQREDGSHYRLKARFVLDASGYGRVLARLEGLSRPPRLTPRMALFTHIDDRIDTTVPPGTDYDRDKVLIGLHPQHASVWSWLIPFAHGRASLGFVGDRDAILASAAVDATPAARHAALLAANPQLQTLLGNATPRRDVGVLEGYSADVSRLHGPGYALLGNAGEFLDPVFSSGVTIAIRSASMAGALVARQLDGERPDWDAAFEAPLRRGVEVFRAFVEAWYDGRLPAIIFHPDPPVYLKRMISAVLAGYAWDMANPFAAEPRRRLDSLAELCGHSRS